MWCGRLKAVTRKRRNVMARFERIGGNLYKFTSSSMATDKANAELLFQRAVAADGCGELEGALQLYYQALGYDQSLYKAWTNIGTMWFNRRDYVIAEKCYRNALNIDPEHAMSHFNLARTLEELGRKREAIAAYLRAIAAEPCYGDAHYNLAILYEREVREYRKAVKHWRLYLRYRGGDREDFARCARDGIRRVLSKLPLRVVSARTPSLAVNL